MSFESAAAVVGALTVTLPRTSKESLRRLSATASTSPTTSPSHPLPQLEPSWWPAPSGKGMQDGGRAAGGGGQEASSDSPTALLTLLRASLPVNDGSDSALELQDHSAASPGRQQHTAETALLGLNVGSQAASPLLSRKRSSRLSFFGKSKQETEQAAPSAPSSVAGLAAGAAAVQEGITQQQQPLAAAGGETRAAPTSSKPAKHKNSGWFGGLFSSGKAKVAESSASGKGESSSGSSTPPSRHASASEYAAPITGGLAICEQQGPKAGEEASADVQQGSAAVASHPVAPTEGSEGSSSRAPSPAAAASDAAAGDGGSSKPHHRRHRSLTQILQQGLGLKGLGRARRHSGGNSEEILGENSLEGSDSFGEGQKAGSTKSSPQSDSLEAAPPSKPSGGSPALSCFGLGVRGATIGDDEVTPAPSPVQPAPLSPVPDFSNLVLIEEPAVPLNAVGIRNIGNSCFLGAALQCLRHTPGLLQVLAPEQLEQPGEAADAEGQQAQQQQGQESDWTAPPGGAVAKKGQEEQQGAHLQQEGSEAAPAAVAGSGDDDTSEAQSGAPSAGADGSGLGDGASPQEPQRAASAAEEAAEGPAGPEGKGPAGAASAGSPQEGPQEGRGEDEQQQEQPAGSDVATAGEGAQAGAAAAAAVLDQNLDQAATGNPGGAAAGAESGPPASGAASGAAEEGAKPELPAATASNAAGAVPPAAPARAQRPEHGELKAAVAALMKELQSQDPSSAVDPHQLLCLLRRFPTAADYFDGGQHDCQEMLRVLMDLLHEDLNRAPKPAPALPEDKPDPDEAEAAKADRHWARYLAHDSSPITDLFSGQLQSSVSCRGCGRRFTMYEPFWDLSLPLAKEGKNSSLSWLGMKGTPATIQDCLRVFTADETLEGEEAFHCEVCKDKTSASKHLRIHRFPDVLVLHIKRFKYKGSNTDKLTANVSFPLKELCLHQFASPESPAAPEDCCYDLFAVSNHFGTLSGGHYTAICRAPQEGGREAWYSYNDEVVTKIGAKEAVSPHAYILFYTRRKYMQRSGGAARSSLLSPTLPLNPRHTRSRSSSSNSGAA